MKKQLIFLVLFMGLFSLTNNAQDKKMMLGVNLGLSSKKDVSSSFELRPSFGYWLNDHSVIIGELEYGSDKDKVATPNITTTEFGIGVHYRYGWHQGDHTFFYLSPGVHFSSHKVDDGTNSSTDKHFEIELTPGIDYMLGDSWSINAEMGLLNFTSISPEVGESTSNFTVNLNMSVLKFGLWYHF